MITKVVQECTSISKPRLEKELLCRFPAGAHILAVRISISFDVIWGWPPRNYIMLHQDGTMM